MSEIDNGGPAFPHMKRPRPELGAGVSETITDGGMSLRDWFAGQALAGISGHHGFVLGTHYPRLRAENAYLLADAMLEARKNKS
jgi:hypothetical protein